MSVGWSPQIAVVDTSLRDVVALRSLLRLPNGFGRADTCRLRETAKVTPDSKPSRYSKRGDVDVALRATTPVPSTENSPSPPNLRCESFRARTDW
jgi:hypothetical protein